MYKEIIKKNPKGRILVVFTGGTIGSIKTDGVVSPENGTAFRLLDLYLKKHGEKITFDTLFPLTMLSENVQQSDLRKIAECIRGIDTAKYDGIILTHGTDTLHFTAAYLSLLFADIPVPLVLVSSAYPLDNRRQNGLANFEGGVAFIQTAISGVFVAYKNPEEACKIHLASRLLPARERDGRFFSLGTPLAKIVSQTAKVNEAWLPLLNKKREACPYSDLSSAVLPLHAEALLDYSLFRFKIPPAAAVIHLYHSGTVCTKGNGENVVNFLKYCKDNGILAVLAPVNSKANVYESAKDLTKNAVLANDCTFTIALIKTMLAVQAKVDIRTLLNENYFFENLQENEGEKSP